ncbi:hypothetical protein SCLCIDRAFT_732782 [Scleroderma citrinum Foug A]|uniref:Uncharacterized protein n=1 Tax=Scleroderma citrinum Foug A TaxID=1036808 RepID=A0A0C3DSP6_9AGAM|nr:hypothetical protein SCLCIDRAFT_732782 [Scleroderma citrinum Foug A]
MTIVSWQRPTIDSGDNAALPIWISPMLQGGRIQSFIYDKALYYRRVHFPVLWHPITCMDYNESSTLYFLPANIVRHQTHKWSVEHSRSHIKQSQMTHQLSPEKSNAVSKTLWISRGSEEVLSTTLPERNIHSNGNVRVQEVRWGSNLGSLPRV